MRRSSLKCNKTGTQSPWKGAFWSPKFLKGSSPFATNFRGQELLVSGVLLDCQEHFLGGTMIIESLIIITVDCIFSGTSWFSSSFFFWNSPMWSGLWKMETSGIRLTTPNSLGFRSCEVHFLWKNIKTSQKVDSTFHDDMVMTSSMRSLVQLRWTSWTQLTTWELKATKVRPLLKIKILGTPKQWMLSLYPRGLFQIPW